MSHPEQVAFVASVKDRCSAYFTGKRILEVGSRNVNGSVREFFSECDYTGIDAVAGDGVDVVCLAHEYRDSNYFDVIITCEMLEHDPWLIESLQVIISLLKPGGMFVGTCAGPNRDAHGTLATADEDGPYGPDENYYGNVHARTLIVTLLAHAIWDVLHTEYGRERQDLYWYGIKG